MDFKQTKMLVCGTPLGNVAKLCVFWLLGEPTLTVSSFMPYKQNTRTLASHLNEQHKGFRNTTNYLTCLSVTVVCYLFLQSARSILLLLVAVSVCNCR